MRAQGIVSDEARQMSRPGSDTGTSAQRRLGPPVGDGIMALSLMSARRSLVRFWRRLRRPSLTRLVVASLALHLVLGVAFLTWLAKQPLNTPPSLQEPLVVELPPAEPGQPLVKPEAPPTQSAPRAAAPPRPAPAAKAPPPPPVA